MLIAALSGFAAGIIGGMGIGGGTILIPVLTLFLGLGQKEAQSTNLLFFIPTALSALYVHIKNKRIQLKKAAVLIAAGVIGAALGAVAANYMEGDLLRKLFAVLLIVFGFRELFKKQES